MSDIILGGCTPTPLANYLKALGVLRLLSDRRPEARAAWRGEAFLLRTPLTSEQIEQFFLREYCPTPVMAPWNGGSGFYYQERKSKDKDPTTGKKRKLGVRDQPTAATKTVDSILASTSARLAGYRKALALGRALVKQSGLVEAPENGKPKDDWVCSLRGALPDTCLEWLDAAILTTAGATRFPPLLGTGGNDGHLDFTSNFMQRLIEVIGTTEELLPAPSADWLRISLFGEGAPGLINSSIGQFSPGQAGGLNATVGFDGNPSINPWDFVLMIEGALPFAAAVVRRNADDPYGVLSYPFTVKTVGAGAGGLGEGDAANGRGELWMPLWGRLASYAEIRALLSEGRVALGRKPARDGLDFVRAIHHLGGYRGICSFQRYGLLMRSGKAYLATPLGRIEVTGTPRVSLLDELDRNHWLDSFRKFAQSDAAPSRFQVLRHRIENAFFESSSRDPSPGETQAVLALLGEIQSALAGSSKAKEVVDPPPRLSGQWVERANDLAPAFRIARALAGLRGRGNLPLPILAQLFPVHPRSTNKWAEAAGEAGDGQSKAIRAYTPTAGSLPHVLGSLLARRLLLAEQLKMQDKPLDSPAGATLDDVAAFLQSDSMDRSIAALLPGLSLCEIPRDEDHSAGDGVFPAAFALLRLCFAPNSILRNLGVLERDRSLPVPPGILAQLASGYGPERAVLTAWRRLRASGLKPTFTPGSLPSLAGISPRRVAAALLIPLRYGAYRRLARSVLQTPDSAGDPAG